MGMGTNPDHRRLLWRSLPGWIPILLGFLDRVDRLISKWSNSEFVFDKLRQVRGGGYATSLLGSALFQITLIAAGLFWIAWVVAQQSNRRDFLWGLKRLPQKHAV